VWRTLVLGAEEEKGLYDFPYGGAQKKRKAVDRVTLSVSKIQITKTNQCHKISAFRDDLS